MGPIESELVALANAMESAFHIVLIVLAVVIPVTCICYAVSDNIETIERAIRRARRRYVTQSANRKAEMGEREIEYPPLFKKGSGRHRKVA